jgi:Protein of unknown function (DUF938)
VPLAKAVRAAGALAHLALLPQTQPSRIPGGRDAFDGVLLLTAPAGGGAFDAGALDRVRKPFAVPILYRRWPDRRFPFRIAQGEWRGACGHRRRTIRRKRPRRTRKTPRRPCRGIPNRLGSAGIRGATITLGFNLPSLVFQPSDPEADARLSVAAWVKATSLQPTGLSCINMIHISPWETTVGLIKGAAAILPSKSPLYLHGPYKCEGCETSPSNQAFDQRLRDRDPN